MPSGYEVTTHGGLTAAGIDAVDWARRGVDLEMITAVRAAVDVPLIASGGAGQATDFPPAVAAGADAVLAASVFHFGSVTVADVKAAIGAAGYPVRLPVGARIPALHGGPD